VIEHIPFGNEVQKRNIEGIRQKQIVDIIHYPIKNMQVQIMATNKCQIDIRTSLVISLGSETIKNGFINLPVARNHTMNERNDRIFEFVFHSSLSGVNGSNVSRRSAIHGTSSLCLLGSRLSLPRIFLNLSGVLNRMMRYLGFRLRTFAPRDSLFFLNLAGSVCYATSTTSSTPSLFKSPDLWTISFQPLGIHSEKECESPAKTGPAGKNRSKINEGFISVFGKKGYQGKP
jgi:hypothetical protein